MNINSSLSQNSKNEDVQLVEQIFQEKLKHSSGNHVCFSAKHDQQENKQKKFRNKKQVEEKKYVYVYIYISCFSFLFPFP